jgi:preprotein translocase subunit SecF
MEFFSHNTKIDFMGQRKWAALFSCILFIFSIGSLIFKGFNFGLDFTGGTQMEVSFPVAPEFSQIKDQLTKAGFEEAVVLSYGSSKNFLVKLKPHQEFTSQQLTEKVLTALPASKLQRVEFIGPQIGKTLVTNGLLAIVISLLGTMIYIAIRFEYRFAISAAISLIHDPMLILGLFSFFGIEFDLTSLAAVLTVIGYSLNDTIVVYDRVRENFRKLRKASPVEILNLSVNQTLSRTIMTSGLTFMVILSLLIFGGHALFGFSLAMLIGIVIGTYSSIYIAGALAITFGLEKTHLARSEKRKFDDLP